jgi:hypothetical protein
VLLRLGGFAQEFFRCQDHELLLRLWAAGERVLYAPDMVVTAPIDHSRLTRTYHRRWHARRGRYAAAMQLEERIDEQGRVRSSPQDTPRLFGAPGYVYADAARHAAAWLAATLARDRARAAHHEHRARYLGAYLRATAALSWQRGVPLLRDAVRFVRVHARRRAAAVNMSAGRMLLAHLLVALLIGGSAYDVATGTEHWPFSPYAMFSTVARTATLDSVVVRGVVNEPDGREVPLRDGTLIGPFDQCRLTTALQRVRSSGDRNRFESMLQDCLARYEAARLTGKHDGPALGAVRAYEAHWILDPAARNVDEPTRSRLVGEVAASPAVRAGERGR